MGYETWPWSVWAVIMLLTCSALALGASLLSRKGRGSVEEHIKVPRRPKDPATPKVVEGGKPDERSA